MKRLILLYFQKLAQEAPPIDDIGIGLFQTGCILLHYVLIYAMKALINKNNL